MARILFFFLLALVCIGCGVKAPPIAPEQVPKDERNLDCSVHDPECDRIDPNYKSKVR